MPDTLPESELNISTGLRQNFSLNSLDVSSCSSGVFLRQNTVVNRELFIVYGTQKNHNCNRGFKSDRDLR